MKRVKISYGFVADPTISLLHNITLVILDMPAWLYYARPQHIAYHNLCLPTFKVSPGLKSLLGLGLNFCPRPEFSNKKSDVQLSRFYRDCNTHMFFCGTEKPTKESNLFIRSEWSPDVEEIPSEFRARVSAFIKRVGSF